MKRILRLAAISTFSIMITMTPGALAYDGSAARLTIMPKLCVVDVTQDGSNQTLQTPSSDCLAALPNLVPSAGQAPSGPLIALPFAGSSQDQPLLPSKVEDKWSPIVSKEQGGPATHTTTSLNRVATGLAMASIASAVGIDIALFEMHYSRSMLRWLRRF